MIDSNKFNKVSEEPNDTFENPQKYIYCQKKRQQTIDDLRLLSFNI